MLFDTFIKVLYKDDLLLYIFRFSKAGHSAAPRAKPDAKSNKTIVEKVECINHPDLSLVGTNVCRISKTFRDKDCLAYSGFMYFVNRTMFKKTENRMIYYWTCRSRFSKNCMGKVHTVMNQELNHEVRGVSEHNHPPDELEFIQRDLKRDTHKNRRRRELDRQRKGREKPNQNRVVYLGWLSLIHEWINTLNFCPNSDSFILSLQAGNRQQQQSHRNGLTFLPEQS